MPDQTTSTIVVAAPPDAVMDVIADFPAYPEWTGSVRSAEVLSTEPSGRAREVRFEMNAGPISDDYTLGYTWGRSEVRWTLVRAGVLRTLDGAYVLEPTGDDACEVTYRLSVAISMPLIGPLKRKAEKTIIDTALKGLKERVEATRKA